MGIHKVLLVFCQLQLCWWPFWRKLNVLKAVVRLTQADINRKHGISSRRSQYIVNIGRTSYHARFVQVKYIDIATPWLHPFLLTEVPTCT